MKWLAIVFSLTLNLNTQAQIIPSSCEITPEIREKYHLDAHALAVSKFVKYNRPEKDSVKIPQADVDTMIRALAAVYHAKTLTHYNAISELHENYTAYIEQGVIYADTNKLWAKNLKNNTIPCGEPYIDSMISLYKLKVIDEFEIAGTYYITYTSDNPLNYIVLSKMIKDNSNAMDAQPNYTVGDGNHIYRLYSSRLY